MEEIKVQLPAEINDLALKVPENKQLEVRTVLDSIFAGTEAWEKQVDEIKVKDINDSMSIGLADAARKNAKTARLNAEKIFDEKRAEVQLRMQDDKLEDALWLKSKQITQLKLKHIEEKAKFKADFVKRYEAEQLQLRDDLRLQKVSQFIDIETISKNSITTMTDEIFDVYLSGIEKAYNDKIEAEKKIEEARIENERIEKLKFHREDEIKLFWHLIPENHPNFGTLSDDEWNDFTIELNRAKIAEDVEKERIKNENQRLIKEAQEKARLAKKEAERIEKEREEERKKQAEILEKQRKEAEEKARIEAKKKAKIEAELKAKADKERIEKERIEVELLKKEQAESEALRAKEKFLQAELTKGDAEKVIDLINNLEALKVKYKFESAENINKYVGVGELIDKVIGYIKK